MKPVHTNTINLHFADGSWLIIDLSNMLILEHGERPALPKGDYSANVLIAVEASQMDRFTQFLDIDKQ